MTVCPGCKLFCIVSWIAELEMELGQMDCEASRCAVCSRVVLVWVADVSRRKGGEWSERGECSGSVWHPDYLLYLTWLCMGGNRLNHLTSHTTVTHLVQSLPFLPSFMRLADRKPKSLWIPGHLD